MKLLENLKLDRWYGIVLYLGVMMIGASLHFKVDFIEEKHLFGIGLGMLLIGVSFLMAEKYAHQIAMGNLFSTKVTKHNIASFIVLILGLILIGLFGYLIVIGLV